MPGAARQVSILGSTGSIGRNTLDVLRRHPQQFSVYALAANASTEAMLAQCVEFAPRWAVMMDADAADEVVLDAAVGQLDEGSAADAGAEKREIEFASARLRESPQSFRVALLAFGIGRADSGDVCLPTFDRG